MHAVPLHFMYHNFSHVHTVWKSSTCPIQIDPLPEEV